MNPDIQKFGILANTDPEVQEKLRAAVANYDGDKSDSKAVFDSVVAPVANEVGLSATFEEFESFIKGMGMGTEAGELSEDELEQVAGGKKFKGLGLGLIACRGLGFGGGAAGSDEGGGVCALLGIGVGDALCLGPGEGDDE